MQRVFKKQKNLKILKIPKGNITIYNLLTPTKYIELLPKNYDIEKTFFKNKELMFLTKEDFKKEQSKFKFLPLKNTEFSFIDEDKIVLVKYNNIRYVYINYTDVNILNEILNSSYLKNLPFLIAPYTLLNPIKNRWLYQNIERIKNLTILTWYCPCGNLLSKDKCTCSSSHVQKYLNILSIKISPYINKVLTKIKTRYITTEYKDVCKTINELTL